MAVTATQFQNIILTEINDTLSGPVGAQLAILWDMYAGKALIAPQLQYFYTLKKAIEMMMGVRRNLAIDQRDGDLHLSQSQEISTLDKMLKEVKEDIHKIEVWYRNTRTVQVGLITKTEPIRSQDDPRTQGLPDAGDRRYRGDPLLPIANRRFF